jgi:hypothetical protein
MLSKYGISLHRYNTDMGRIFHLGTSICFTVLEMW